MPKRHTSAVFLAELRARTAGQIIRLERMAEDVSQTIAGARRDLEAIDLVIRVSGSRVRLIGSCRGQPSVRPQKAYVLRFLGHVRSNTPRKKKNAASDRGVLRKRAGLLLGDRTLEHAVDLLVGGVDRRLVRLRE